jgi:hypothetical protein
VTVAATRVAPEWLALRERADAAARSTELVHLLLRRPPGEWVIHDLASGTGAMGRWLAPQLPGEQRWVLHDLDADLLRRAAARPPAASDVHLETRQSDVTRLRSEDLAGATLITASALLDLLTAEELVAVTDICCAAGCAVLLMLSVTGEVALEPSDPLDARVASAFNAHQRRQTPRGRLLGPDAQAAAADALRRAGAEVVMRASPWRLDSSTAALTVAWITGWLRAAFEHEPGLAVEAQAYARKRLDQARRGRLSVTVGHADLLVLP